MRTRELQENWLIWLDASDRLTRSLHELTVAITLRDSERINRLRPETQVMRRQMRDIEEDIETATLKIAASLGTTADVRGIASVLEKAEAQSVNGLANRVVVAGRTVRYLLEKNEELFRCRFAVVHSGDPVDLPKVA